MTHSDGSTRWIAATARNFLDDPSIDAVVCNFRDMTQQKVAEAALLESQRTLEEVQIIAHLGRRRRQQRQPLLILDHTVAWASRAPASEAGRHPRSARPVGPSAADPKG